MGILLDVGIGALRAQALEGRAATHAECPRHAASSSTGKKGEPGEAARGAGLAGGSKLRA
jgi:hypothetical protein